MASAFGHALAAVAFGTSFEKKIRTGKFWILGVICSVLPDADALGFKLGVPYDSFWGHRGFTHSLVFAAIIGVVVTMIFFKGNKAHWTKYILFFALCTASHDLLDMMTNGGRGVALLSPFNNERFFLPWRPIQVSPIGIGSFFSEWGKRVLMSELVWIGIPALAYVLLVRMVRGSR